MMMFFYVIYIYVFQYFIYIYFITAQACCGLYVVFNAKYNNNINIINNIDGWDSARLRDSGEDVDANSDWQSRYNIYYLHKSDDTV